MKKALLVLEDGFTLEGNSFTGDFECGGEVIFATSMFGYQEILTDPSYYGQMICMTYPLIGNYGIAPKDMESAKIHATALLVRECCQQPSNWRAKMSLPEFLHQYNTPGMENLDTRALTRHLRIKGAMRGIISTEEMSPTVLQDKARQLPTMQGYNPIQHVAPTSPYIWQDNAPCSIQLEADGAYKWRGTGLRLLVYDFGIKWNILRLLTQTGFEVLVVPPSFSCEAAVATGTKGIFLSNGPGDPAAMSDSIQLVRELLEKFPVTGICLGHQLIASALGGKTTKLTFGHHGVNHPVKCLANGRVEITSQNHGFCVLADGLNDVEITHINLNDGTVEGLRHKYLPVMSVQYHPEANAGPHDSNYLFKNFYDLLAHK